MYVLGFSGLVIYLDVNGVLLNCVIDFVVCGVLVTFTLLCEVVVRVGTDVGGVLCFEIEGVSV